ncbi:thaumatin-like protein [Tanacetum coccineum]
MVTMHHHTTTILLLILTTLHLTSSTTILMVNKCSHPVWPGIQPGGNSPILARGGFKLPPSKSYTLFLPPNWSGRLWGREGCSFSSTGHGHCNTGDCGGALYCNGTGGEPPATLAEITLAAEFDFYDVSLVDGYNLPIAIKPLKGTGYCRYVGCVSDLNVMCPVGLQVRSRDKRRVVACKSACSVFKSPRFCCTGNYGNAFTCKATAYSKIFKVACPRAYSYAYDDATSLATCTSASYLLTFCVHR